MSGSMKHRNSNIVMGFKILQIKALWRVIWKFLVNLKTCMDMHNIYLFYLDNKRNI